MHSIPIHHRPERYLNPHQAQTREPTSYEVLLGDAIDMPILKKKP